MNAPLADAHGRLITYLRLSVTDRCNFRCVYCSPAYWSGRSDYLSTDELVRLASVFANLGVNRIRLTGGEPLLRPDIVELARRLKNIEGIRELCLTTNASRLADYASDLAAAGVDRVNVSLDSTDEKAFAAATVRGSLKNVLEGLAAASRAGFGSLALNVVVMEGVNDDAWSLSKLVELAWAHGAVPRFIELMPFAGGGAPVPTREVVARLESAGFRIDARGHVPGAGPARYVEATRDDRSGEIGFIGAMTENFCDRCNRVRVTSKGELRACLGGRDQVPLAHLLRSGASDEELSEAIRAALGAKWDRHRFHERGRLLPMMDAGG